MLKRLTFSTSHSCLLIIFRATNVTNVDTEKMELISPANNDSVIEVQRAEDQEIQQRTKIMFESSVLPLSRGGKAEKIQKRYCNT